MSKKFVNVIKDLKAFDERTDEILGEKDQLEQLKYLQSVISDLKTVLKSERDYVCVCAPQIGEKLRLFVVKTADTSNIKGRYKVFINPIIVKNEGMHLSREINISIPGKEFIVPRYDKVHIAYQSELGQPCSETYIGSYGEVVQQMIQMLDGITLADIGLEVDADFDNASDKDKRAIIQMYLEALGNSAAELKQEIEETPELKNIEDTIKMQTGLLTGDIVPLDENGNPVTAEKENTESKSEDSNGV